MQSVRTFLFLVSTISLSLSLSRYFYISCRTLAELNAMRCIQQSCFVRHTGQPDLDPFDLAARNTITSGLEPHEHLHNAVTRSHSTAMPYCLRHHVETR